MPAGDAVIGCGSWDGTAYVWAVMVGNGNPAFQSVAKQEWFIHHNQPKPFPILDVWYVSQFSTGSEKPHHTLEALWVKKPQIPSLEHSQPTDATPEPLKLWLCSFSPCANPNDANDTNFFTGSCDGTAKVKNLKTGQEAVIAKHDKPIRIVRAYKDAANAEVQALFTSCMHQSQAVS